MLDANMRGGEMMIVSWKQMRWKTLRTVRLGLRASVTDLIAYPVGNNDVGRSAKSGGDL